MGIYLHWSEQPSEVYMSLFAQILKLTCMLASEVGVGLFIDQDCGQQNAHLVYDVYVRCDS